MSKATIIVPVYNKERYLKETLTSIDKQTEDDLEVIIIDDASTDNSMDIIYDFANNTKKQIRIIKNDKNMGVAYSRNIGLEEAKADYISFLDADDVIDNDFMEFLLSKFKQYPTIDFCNGQFIMSEHPNCDDRRYHYFNEKVLSAIDCIDEINCSACAKLYKKDSIKNIRFVESAFEDYEFFLNMLANNLVSLSPDFNTSRYYYRISSDGKYRTSAGKIMTCFDNFDIYDRIEREYPQMDFDMRYAIRKLQIDICGCYLKKVLLSVELSSEDRIDFIKNYMQFLKVRYLANDYLLQFFVGYDMSLLEDTKCTDSEIIKENIKRIAMKY